MTTSEKAQQVVFGMLFEHFDIASDQLNPEQIAETTGLSADAVSDALAALWTAHRIEGIDTADAGYPRQVTRVAPT